MAFKLTSQDIKEMAQFWGSNLFSPQDFRDFLKTLPVKERIAYISAMPAEERLTGLNPEERLMGLKPEERLAGINPSDMVNYFKQANVPVEEIEAILEQLRK